MGDDSHALCDALPGDGAAVEPQLNAIAPNDGEDIPIDKAASLTKI